MTSRPSPDQAYLSFEQEVDLLESAGRSGEPTRDAGSKQFYELPYDEFVHALVALRDEVEERAYLSIVAATEAVLQVDFRSRIQGKAATLLRDEARRLNKRERQGKRIELEDILDAWVGIGSIDRHYVSEFKQLMPHRHWLAHGRYFEDRAPVPADPGFALQRARALFQELRRIDPTFPREV